jgi:NitT/TauT family transport system permease protein
MIFSTKTRITWMWRLILMSVPFVLMIGLYLGTSYKRHQDNPDDKLVPTISKLVEGAKGIVTPDKDGKIQLWTDTSASGKRFGIGLAINFTAIPFGVMMACFPFWDNLLSRFTLFIDKVQPMSLLPIFFIAFGLGELSKQALMLFGVFPTVCLDAYLRAKKVPQEELQTAQTLDASGFETVWLVVFPRIFPEMLDTIRLNFKSMAALLLMGEALAATEGLGYRIYVVRRYMAMDVIIPYVILITLFLFLADYGFQQWVKRFRWAKSE